MNLTLERAALSAALKTVGASVSGVAVHPMTAAVLLEVGRDKMRLTTNNFEARTRTIVAAEVTEPGVAAVLHAPLAQFVAALPDGAQVALTVKDNRMTVKSGRARATIGCLPHVEFPIMELVNAKDAIALDAAVLKTCIDRTLFAVGAKVAHVEGLSSLYVALDDGYICGCNRHIGAISFLGDRTDTPPVLIPADQAKALAGVIAGITGELSLAIGDNGVEISAGDLSVMGRIAGDKYPNVKAFFDAGAAYPKVGTVSRQALIDAITRTSIADDTKERSVRLIFADNRIEISAAGKDGRDADDVVDCEYTAERHDVPYRIDLLLPVLRAVPTDTIRFRLNGRAEMMLLEPTDDTRDRWLIMPYGAA